MRWGSGNLKRPNELSYLADIPTSLEGRELDNSAFLPSLLGRVGRVGKTRRAVPITCACPTSTRRPCRGKTGRATGGAVEAAA